MARPTADDVQQLLLLAGSREDFDYAFDRLRSPAWIPALREAGVFASPEESENRGAYVIFPSWGPSRYLARVAAADPDATLDVLLHLPATKNWRIQADVIEAALRMPVGHALRLAPMVVAWLSGDLYGLVPDRAAELMRHFAERGAPDAALDLARPLLALQPIEPPKFSLDEERATQTEAIPRIEDYFYRTILSHDAKILSAAAPRATLGLLCDVLEAGLDLEQLSTVEALPGMLEDYSMIWRPAIEDHEQNNDFDIPAVLVAAVRDAALAATDAGVDVIDILEALRRRRYVVFERIALHVLRTRAGSRPDLIAAVLSNRRLVHCPATWHEFAGLASDWFGRVDPEVRAAYLDVIRQDLDAPAGDPGLLGSWAKRLLWAVRGDLAGEWVGRFRQLATDATLLDHPDFLTYSSAWHGPESPLSDGTLAALSVDAVIAYLQEWKPSEPLFAPSADGLGQTLGRAVAADPERFAGAAPRFQALSPAYIDGLLFGLAQAVRAARPFDWPPVLELCAFVADRPVDIPADGDWDRTWRAAQQGVGWLLDTALRADPVPIPRDAARAVWTAIAPLTGHPDPTPDDEARYGEPNRDWAGYSINTVRPQAIHAVCSFWAWLGADEAARASDGHLETTLTRHLDVTADPSMAVRSVYGSWLPRLAELDPIWMAGALDAILPLDPDLEPYRRTAWDAYQSGWWPGRTTFELLRAQYGLAVRRAFDFPADDEARRDRHAARLAAQVALLFFRGWVVQEELPSLFLELAPPTARAALMEHLGRLLTESAAVSDDTVTRLRNFWDARDRDSVAEEDRALELRAFGWWFSSPHLEPDWAISTLLGVVRRMGRVDASWHVLKKLTKMTSTHPRDAVEIVRLLTTGPDPDAIVGFDEHIKEILRAVLGGSDPEATTRATELIHELGRRGYRDLGELLRPRDELKSLPP